MPHLERRQKSSFNAFFTLLMTPLVCSSSSFTAPLLRHFLRNKVAPAFGDIRSFAKWLITSDGPGLNCVPGVRARGTHCVARLAETSSDSKTLTGGLSETDSEWKRRQLVQRSASAALSWPWGAGWECVGEVVMGRDSPVAESGRYSGERETERDSAGTDTHISLVIWVFKKPRLTRRDPLARFATSWISPGLDRK